jgi:hypothetical protein
VSVAIGPETVELSPYCKVKDPGCACAVNEAAELYLFLPAQLGSVQDTEGTHKSEDPA